MANETNPENPTTTKKRGRPRVFDRDAALAKATELFWRKGYEATSISNLTEAMNIRTPSLYAAFGSKEALYIEVLEFYQNNYGPLVWGRFFNAESAQKAIENLLLDSAATLTGCKADIPNGCMVSLSSVASEGYLHLGDIVQNARSLTFDRIKARLDEDVKAGKLKPDFDTNAFARYIQNIQLGMSVLARDGATRKDLEGVAEMAMLTLHSHNLEIDK
ncbi:HTH-type transcriptional repressor ComR [Thalassocella blandensis]|nr:HTH-type transcriptional repressor ComR [Thalassocella blandensis]